MEYAILDPEAPVMEVRPTTFRRLTNEELQQAWQWCNRYGRADDWMILAEAYLRHGYQVNAYHYFKKAQELYLEEKGSPPVAPVLSNKSNPQEPETLESVAALPYRE